METKGEIKLSPKYKKDDYSKLNLNANSDDQVWDQAIEIIKDRIYGRYFNQIDLLSNDINANGFAIMALNCLLIETLLQFRDGKAETPAKNNKATYSNFLIEEFSSAFDTQPKAGRFYTDIRCGILHSAQTKNNSRLSDRKGFVVKFENDTLVVSVKGVSNVLKDYFKSYVKKLSDPKETTLRKNFVKKMKFVCRE